VQLALPPHCRIKKGFKPMAHIKLPEGFPGIRGPLMFSPATARPLRELAEILMRGPSTLTPAEREIIGTFVSSQNDCYYCQTCHGSTAAHLLDGNFELIDEIKRDFEAAAISPKLKALLVIAGKVQQSGKLVTTQDIERARQHGATDLEIHDTVLIAASFCLFNRYVDGLGTWAPSDPEVYRAIGEMTARDGYLRPGGEKQIGREST
jgi:uncharacterized peroxidase-related enzyme